MRDSEAAVKARQQLDGLKVQAKMKRIPVSKAIKDLMAYTKEHFDNDKLLNPDGDNPFKPKKKCVIL